MQIPHNSYVAPLIILKTYIKTEQTMVTKVGLESDIYEALKSLIVLDNDAAEACEAAIQRLDATLYKAAFQTFKRDHQKHMKELSTYLIRSKQQLPKESDMKRILAQGKDVIANLIGDSAIIGAMKCIKVDTHKAYERTLHNELAIGALEALLRHGLEDEKRHMSWLQEHFDRKVG